MKKVFVIIIVILAIVLLVFAFFRYKSSKCQPIAGGGFNIIFNLNGGTGTDSMHVCIACSPDSYEDLPTPNREGYTFDGWYYDKELTDKVKVTNSLNVQPVKDTDKFGCMKGYKDINMYAKWSK